MIDPGKPPLKKGRLLGCSAYEESINDDPFEIVHEQARFMEKMPRLAMSHVGGTDFYNHAFAVLDIAPEKIHATYYEYPSWGMANAPHREPEIGDVRFYEEDLLPRAS